MMKKTTRIGLMLACAIPGNLLGAGEAKYLDNAFEEARLFGVASASQQTDHDLALRLKAPYYPQFAHDAYQTPGIVHDFDDKQVGDFSVAYRASGRDAVEKIGFLTDLWGDYPALEENDSLRFELKTEGLAEGEAWSVRFCDAQGRQAAGLLQDVNTRGQWKSFTLALKDLKQEPGFSLDALRLCEFQGRLLQAGAVIKFDFVRFEKAAGEVIGITDKTMARRMAGQQANRQKRIDKAFEVAAEHSHYPVVGAFALMYLNRDLPKANQILREDCRKMGQEDPWSLLTTPLYCRFYHWFSNRCGIFKGRLEPATEKLLLETLWQRTYLKNDIHWARQSTWWLDGSENHDLNAKACNLVTSRIFMDEPEYKDRVYPDCGFGGAYHYGHAGYYGKGVDPATRHFGGRADLSDGKRYTAKDHYDAWLAFMKTYFRERARHGFFLENASSSYAKHTMNMVDLAYACSGDAQLHALVGDFMTLYYANYVQTAIAGVSGGPKTRHHKTVGGYDANTGLIGFHLGGPADGGEWFYWNAINGYELPAVVQRMALDREGMGNFVYQSRGIGESEPTLPHPPGTERTLVINPESRFLKYAYVTPGYVLATQMDHPMAVHSHLSKTGRWHGLTVGQDAKARIVPVVFPLEPDHAGAQPDYSMEGMYKTFQHNHTLIVQMSRSFSESNPAWYPLYPQRLDQGLYLGKAWDEKVEKAGWIFLRKGDVYAGVRVAHWDKAYEEEKAGKQTESTQQSFHGAEDEPTVKLAEKPYVYLHDDAFLKLEDRFSPVIIQAGDRRQSGGFANFMAGVAAAPLALYKTVVPGFHILVFTPPGKDAAEMVFNAANNEIPTLDGKPIDHAPPMTFDSPYLKSPYKSGKIAIHYGEESLSLDFTK